MGSTSTAADILAGLHAVWVLVFNIGTSEEGVYTLKVDEGRAHVLAFERDDDADRYAALLQAEGFDLATPYHWDAGQLTAFCEAEGHERFHLSYVPAEAHVMPPDQNEYNREAYDRMEQGASAPEPRPRRSRLARVFALTPSR